MGKIYTKTGDTGMTSLIGGKRVPKSNVLVEIYGSIDELASFVGVLFDVWTISSEYKSSLIDIQETLLKIEAFYASGMLQKYDIDSAAIGHIQDLIDEIDSGISPLSSFVIPGSNIASSYGHVCRTICRRCERHATKVDNSSFSLVYLNRLSDYFFVLARKLSSDGNL